MAPLTTLATGSARTRTARIPRRSKSRPSSSFSASRAASRKPARWTPMSPIWPATVEVVIATTK
jgi:hypothetical protein